MIAVRAARPTDAEAIAAIYAPHVVAGHATFEDEVPDAAEMARRIASSDLHPWMVAEQGGRILAYAYAAPYHPRRAYRWTVETSVYVAEEAHGQGVGTRLYEALLAELVNRGFARAIARISQPGVASDALHRSFGFDRIGIQRAVGWKNGRWIDVSIWQRALAELPDPPPEPHLPAQSRAE